MHDIAEVVEMLDQKKEIMRKQKKLRLELEQLVEMIEATCPHPTIKRTDEYYEGGYDYVSRVKITNTCTLCEKILESYYDPEHKGYHA